MAKSRATISFPVEDYAALLELARKHDVSVAWVVRSAVSQLLRALSEGTEQLPLPLESKRTIS